MPITLNRKKTLIAVAAVSAGAAAYALAGFYLLPKIALSKLPQIVKEQTGQTPQLQQIRLNPFSWVLELREFSLPAGDGQLLAGFEALRIDLAAWESIKLGGVVVDSIELSKLQLNIARRADGRFNFADLQPEQAEAEAVPAAPEADTGPLKLLIRHAAIVDGKLAWLDASTGQALAETLVPVNLMLQDISTQAGQAGNGKLTLGIESGGSIEWSGDFSLQPLASKGHLQLDAIGLDKVWQLFLQQLPIRIAAGRAGLQIDYDLTSADSGVAVLLHNGALALQQLAVVEKNSGKPLIDLPELAVDGIGVDVEGQTVNVAGLTSRNAAIQAWLQADGTVNYQALFGEDAAAATAGSAQTGAGAPAAAEPGKPWSVRLGELALHDYQIHFTDFSQAKPAEFKLSELNCKLQNFSSDLAGKVPLQFSTRLNQTGSLALNGDMLLQPFAADWDVQIKNLQLKPFQPYLDPFLKLELVDGDVNLIGKLHLAVAEPFQLTFNGDADVDNLLTRDQLKNKDFLKWSNLALDGIAVDLAAQDFKLAKVLLERPYVRFNIKKDGSTNIDEILVEPKAEPVKTAKPVKTAAKPAAAKAKAKADEPSISIGKIEMRNGKSDFADYSLILPFVAEMNGLNGEVRGFSSDQDAAATMALKGKVYDMALVGIKGKYQFQSGDSDIALNFTHMPLPLITPYMAEFAGYRIEKGQMALDLHYKIKRGQLEVQNKLFIDQLTLGDKVENPNAVSLPLHLAIALLKDADGKINLDFPITGSLEDPQFSVGALVRDVLVNLVKKVAMSPFKAIASLLSDDKDFSSVQFTPGSAELAKDQADKLGELSKALLSKPELTLEIKGIAYQNQDWPAMRFSALQDVLKKMKSGELRDQGQKIRHEYIQLSDDDYKRLLAKFFAEVFPQDFERSLLGKPRIKSNPDADFYTLARERLEGIFQPDPLKLNDLAVARANHIAQYVTESGGISRDRVYILATELNQDEAADGISAMLTLNAAP
ncbi:DUF748 domain-containing protein [Methylomonas koyamae]|uniref:DUF748 domain-containing protein n=1 Tax=Methylomonas koyamae TaxID=702114 RepID=UPI000BC32809|nr:DUF748 domain-containing protein [Methylomonas koyamae]ATG91298.1 hypothetical protein MKLM6_3099 [Methylomonas koyamae]